MPTEIRDKVPVILVKEASSILRSGMGKADLAT